MPCGARSQLPVRQGGRGVSEGGIPEDLYVEQATWAHLPGHTSTCSHTCILPRACQGQCGRMLVKTRPRSSQGRFPGTTHSPKTKKQTQGRKWSCSRQAHSLPTAPSATPFLFLRKSPGFICQVQARKGCLPTDAPLPPAPGLGCWGLPSLPGASQVCMEEMGGGAAALPPPSVLTEAARTQQDHPVAT